MRDAEQKTALVVSSSDAADLGEGEIGGKALGLTKLGALGALVPEWFVVPASTFRKEIERSLDRSLISACETALSREPGSTSSALEAACETVRVAVSHVTVSGELRKQLALSLTAVGDGPYAVRSSMVGEDSKDFSFAGQLETYLFMRSLDDVGEALKKCWAAAFTPRVLLYRSRAGLPLHDLRVGVVIQRMIDGEVSGVLFTADPTTGRRDTALLNACWGLGEGLVSGVCNADEFVWEHRGNTLDTRLADKDRAVVAFTYW